MAYSLGRRLALGPLTQADKLTWNLVQTDEERPFRNTIFRRLPEKFQVPAAMRYRATWERYSYRDANLELLRLSERLKGNALRLAASDEEIIRFARLRSTESLRAVSQRQDMDSKLSAVLRIAELQGVTPPTGKHLKPCNIIARLCNEHWWRQAVRKSHIRKLEAIAIEMGFVHRSAGLYVSDEALKRRHEQKYRNRQTLAAITAVNEQGDSFTLEELSGKSVSNPANRRAELMVRTRGFETCATNAGHMGIFLTFTTPSRFHARYEDGTPNPRYQGGTPDDAQKWLRKNWARIRAALDRKGIKLYGMRIAEPHHDGTPHWHFLLFLPAEKRAALEEICRRYMLADDGDEPGAQEHRFKLVEIDPAKGSATGYIAKYIAKNIDGFQVGEDLEDPEYRPASETVLRVDAWAATWGTRQFQQIGGPPVTVWRELRRLGTDSPGLIGGAARFADASDWTSYVDLMGGPTVRRKDLPIWLVKAWSDQPNRYGEPKGDVLVGLEAEGERVSTRVHTWVLRYGQNFDADAYKSLRNVALRTVTLETIEQESLDPVRICNVTLRESLNVTGPPS